MTEPTDMDFLRLLGTCILAIIAIVLSCWRLLKN